MRALGEWNIHKSQHIHKKVKGTFVMQLSHMESTTLDNRHKGYINRPQVNGWSDAATSNTYKSNRFWKT